MMGDNKEFTNSLTEAHFCGLQSQSNVYGLCKIDLPSKQSEILVSSLRGKVLSLRFNKTKPISREIKFTYIPGDAEIISIDAFNKFHHGSSVVIGVTFIKVLEGKSCCYLNVYSEWEQSGDFNLDSIAQGWHNIELTFTPYQLSHTEVVNDGNVDIIFLLSGSDRRVHMFKEDKYTKVFTEVADCEHFFPEFSNLPSNVTWLQCEHFQDYQKRVTAIGFFNGMVKVSLVDTLKLEVLSSWITEHDSPITSLKLFPLKNDVECPHFVMEVIDSMDDPIENGVPDLNLLVNNAVESSVVYRNVLECGLSQALTLGDSDKYDCALCGCVADVDLDGSNEVIIGTYGQEMLAYKFVPDTEKGEVHTNITSSSSEFDKSNAKMPLSDKHFNEAAKISNEENENTLANASQNINMVNNSLEESVNALSIKEIQSVPVSSDEVITDQNLTFEQRLDSESDKPKEVHIMPPLSLNLSERVPAITETSKIQSPLDFHSGHFNSDHSLSPLVLENKIDCENVNIGCDRSKASAEFVIGDDNAFDSPDTEQIDTAKAESANSDTTNLKMDEIRDTNTLNCDNKDNPKYVKGEYKLLWKHSFADPVFAINSMDIAGDGLEELVVLTQKGIHILQHDIDQVADLCLQRLKQATFHQGPQEDVFKQLLSENLADSYHDDYDNTIND